MRRQTDHRDRAELSLRGFLTGNPRVREIRIERPIVQLPMARERTRQLSTARRRVSRVELMTRRVGSRGLEQESASQHVVMVFTSRTGLGSPA